MQHLDVIKCSEVSLKWNWIINGFPKMKTKFWLCLRPICGELPSEDDIRRINKR